MNWIHNTLNTARVLRTLESRSSVCMPIPGKDSPANSFVSDVGRIGPLPAPPPVPLERPGVIKVMGEVRIRGTWTYSGILYALYILLKTVQNTLLNTVPHTVLYCTLHDSYLVQHQQTRTLPIYPRTRPPTHCHSHLQNDPQTGLKMGSKTSRRKKRSWMPHWPAVPV
jgi:hypothetical protein